jgi:hypothetical protein
MIENEVYYYDDSIVVETVRGNYKHHAVWWIPRKKADKLGYLNPFAELAIEYLPNAHFRQMGWKLIG